MLHVFGRREKSSLSYCPFFVFLARSLSANICIIEALCKDYYFFLLNKHLNISCILLIYGDYVANVTLSVSEEVHKIMKTHREIRWTEIARQAIVKTAKKFKSKDALSTYNLNRILEEGNDVEELFDI